MTPVYVASVVPSNVPAVVPLDPFVVDPPADISTAPFVFVLSSDTLNANGIIDLDSKQGRELYNKSVTPLTISFNGDSKNINLFISQLSRKAKTSWWLMETRHIMNIPDSNGDNKIVLSEYGCLDDVTIRAHVATYIDT